MKANEKLLLRYLEGADKNFIIPVYQRNYDWKISHCKQLYDDLIAISKNNYRTHFLGSIVSIYSDDGNQEYLVIDGQQRLTTVSLLLLAIHNIIEEKHLDVDANLSNRIRDEYLINKYAPQDKKIRLKPVKYDNDAFERLFNNEEKILTSNITKNYCYFYERILNFEISIDELFKSISRLIIVDIELKKNEDDPQLIFESLNSTGLSLSQADLVRNYILMKESSENQNEIYEKYWNRIENNTSFQTDSFLRNYLTFKLNTIPNKDRVYVTFREFLEKLQSAPDFSMQEFLNELLRFSKYYQYLNDANYPAANVAELLKDIAKLDITVCYPFLLEVFSDYEQGYFDINGLVEILSTIISFSFRRSICEVMTNVLNKMFMSLAKDIKKFSDYKDHYVEIFKYILINKGGTQRFPTDDEFYNMLLTKNLYKMQTKNKIHYFRHMENYHNKEKVDVDSLLEKNVLTIEHIMPQTLNQKWRNDLGEDFQHIHSFYLHSIGNLTLTAYNSEYSNLSFNEKKHIKNGFLESRLFLNSSLKDIERWNKEAIVQRGEMLAKRGLQIWKYPSSAYKPAKTDDELMYNVSEVAELSGKKILYFEFLGEEITVSSWKEFEKEIFFILYDRNPLLFMNIANSDFSNRISTNPQNHTKPYKIAENIYIELNLSTVSVLSLLLKLLKKYQIDEENLMIYVKNKKVKESVCC